MCQEKAIKMEVIKAYLTNKNLSQINTLPVKRNWMDKTWKKHAYHCFPVTLTNTLGWYLSFPEDITFIWDGVSDSADKHVKIIKGEKYAYTGRANSTISFNTGIKFKTNENTTLLTMPAPNFFIDGAQCFTTLISTSFFKGDLPVAWMITKPNTEITIPAGHPICSIIPISLSNINNSEVHILNNESDDYADNIGYSQAVIELNKKAEWSNFYRDAVDHKGNSIGEHEVKSIKLKIIDKSVDI